MNATLFSTAQSAALGPRSGPAGGVGHPAAFPDVFSTCPHSTALSLDDHFRRVVEVAQWSEQAGCKGILIYTDNSTLDAWMIAQVIVQHTHTLCPLVAVQPVYMHPYSVAKMVTTFGHLYGRRTYLNMVAGGFKNDLTALNDVTPHDRRYDRLIEYTTVIKKLLEGGEPLTFDGEFYKTTKLKLTPPLRPELFPGIFVSGSSEAGRDAARMMGATAVHYPKPPAEYETNSPENLEDTGIRVGIVARTDSEEAWRIAYERFPSDRKGQLTHQLAMKTSDSVWHKQLSDMAEEAAKPDNPYWLHPFQNYNTFCPYLVGSYAEVARELTRYLRNGHRNVILDIPPCQEEFQHIRVTFELACGQGAV